MINKLKKSLTKKWSLRLKTKHPDGDNYDGVVIHLSKKIVILHEENDFEFDGIQIFPINFIKNIRDGNFEKCSNKIIKQNRQYKKIYPNNLFKSVETIEDCLKNIKRKNIWPAIETVNNKQSALYIGPIEKIEKGNLHIRCYDAAGEWEKIYMLSFKEIIRIEIKSKYLKHFNNYMKNPITNRSTRLSLRQRCI